MEDFFENGAIGLHMVDRDGIILRANKAELNLLGYSADEYVGRSIADFHADAEVIDDILKRLTAGERLDKYPARMRAKDGSIKHVQINSSVLFRDGDFINTRCFTVDVTGQVEAEAARIEAERRLVETYEHATVGIGETDAAGRFVRVNAAFERLTGYSREELVGKSFAELTHPDDREHDLTLYAEQVAGKLDSYSLEKRYLHKNGSIRDVELLSSVVRSPAGAFQYGVRVLNDISARRRAEELARDTERRCQDLLNALPVAVYTTDRQGRLAYFNEAAATFAGRRPRLGVDEWCVTWKLYWPDGTPLPPDQSPMAVALDTGDEIRGLEAVAERPDGSKRVFTPYPTLLRDSEGNVVEAVNVLVDITERKQAEETQKLLIDELNHRVKNTLATVQSIAMQTQRSTPECFAERFEARLLSLSRAHDLLTRRRWTGVSLRELLEQASAPYMDQLHRPIVLDGPDLMLSARAGLAMALTIHELMTNAAKYGALSGEAGRVAISWSVLEGPEGQGLAICWREQGGPAVAEPSRRGFGLRLIERSIAKDLGGRADLRFASEGLEAMLQFPLAA
ncbi:MAG TPA: PAS domain S-box protein [Sphingomonas sp.]|nr:PAS domain S-box protein [Sphingomonas sp.]